MNTRKKVLMVVDFTNDFVCELTGALTVPGASKIWQNIQNLIDSGNYDRIVYTFDTHTPDEYNGSDEQKIFPGIHCEFGTAGWFFYKIKPQNNRAFGEFVQKLDKPFEMVTFGNEAFFTKNVFDIWAGNKSFPEWFTNEFPVDETEVDVVGVATNYCVFMNVDGLVKRGYKVNVVSDAVEGIKAFPDGSVDPSFEANVQTMVDAGVTFK